MSRDLVLNILPPRSFVVKGQESGTRMPGFGAVYFKFSLCVSSFDRSDNE